MSLPKASSKNKDLHDAVSSFERATLIFKEIEAFIENELADTPPISASYEIPRMKSKRKRGPFLIKPLNKSKARKTLNDMEYDPVRMEWMGNTGALKTFAGGRPALISNKANQFRPKSDGKMVWNAKEQKWEGNYEELRNFEKRTVALIKQRNDIIPKDQNGMSFNPVTMTWEGNFEALLDFGTISEEAHSVHHDDGFKVGTEFQLSPATTQLFADCAARHSAATAGWWREEKSREHLSAIRTMSIMRLVRDVKRAAFAYDEPSYMDVVDKDVPLKLKSPLAEPEVDFDDAWEDVGPFTGTVRVKLPQNTSADIDFDLEELSKFGSVSNRSGKVNTVVDEDWDNDFAEDLHKILPRKLSTHRPIPSFDAPSPSTPPFSTPTPSVSTPVNVAASTSSSTPFASTPAVYNGTVTQLGKDKKPFALLKVDAPQRKSVHNLNTIKGPKVAWDEDEEDGLEIPTEPLKLKLNRAPSTSSVPETASPEGEFDDDEVPVTPTSNVDVGEEVFEGDVEEEDWNDVELPTALGEPVTRRPEQRQPLNYQPPEKEEWDDFEISAERLELKLNQHKQQQQQQPHHKKHSKVKAEEEELDGLDIPDGFQLRLKR